MKASPDKKRSIVGMLISRLLHSYFVLTRGLTLGVRAIVQSDDGKFLLVSHTYTPGWYFPGGGVGKGQTAEDALRIELQQETGLRLRGTPELLGVFHNSSISSRDHVLVYRCQVDGKMPQKPPSMEIAEYGFFDLNALPEGTDAGTERRMREIVEGADQSEAW
ncbi:ADP-ribose pyrophosphatase YjhB, NUDIX family [Roseovarius litoreus]|uniref:ADP-ribose pyrophosphatase YjhB, NUDIX family n=1 Tax=Roseovarius litoreus TaxID=1155722 RepID=A0A1M7KYB4_9RHOB|nr:NUDIX domain-containing protein [Roseovarius litoreus]SHM70263.1 ADP-ribose pyrophosphatase YjhB, NUDIX family [Roseovarius litoreus]